MRHLAVFLCFVLAVGCTGTVSVSNDGEQSQGQAEESTEAEMTPVDGEQLERDMWAAMAAQDWDRVEAKIASGFQSVHEDGARDRAAEIELIEGLELGDYTLSDFQVTRNGPAVVVTYSVAVEETIEGQRMPTEPAMRLSVWLETDDGWQWITHANLNPMKSESSG